MQNSDITRRLAALVMLASLAVPYSASAKPEFLEQFTAEYPAVVGTRLEACIVCHTSPPRRNPYGTDFNVAGRQFPPIEPIDSDGDGVDNLTEIRALTFPGDATDKPGTPLIATATPTHTRTPTPTHTPSPTNTRLPIPTIVPGPCYGDCDRNGTVAVNELILAVNIALDRTNVDKCSLADGDDNGQVSIDELVRAVNRALNGCPPQ